MNSPTYLTPHTNTEKLSRFGGLAVFVLFLVTLFFAFAAHAQGAAVPAVDATDPTAIAKLVLAAIVGKQWGILASGGVLLLIGIVKHYVPDTTKVGAWLHSKPGGWITNFLTTGAMTLLTAFTAGQPFSWGLLVATATTALSGAGLLELVRDVFQRNDPVPAVAAGAAAAANPGPTLNG